MQAMACLSWISIILPVAVVLSVGHWLNNQTHQFPKAELWLLSLRINSFDFGLFLCVWFEGFTFSWNRPVLSLFPSFFFRACTSFYLPNCISIFALAADNKLSFYLCFRCNFLFLCDRYLLELGFVFFKCFLKLLFFLTYLLAFVFPISLSRTMSCKCLS